MDIVSHDRRDAIIKKRDAVGLLTDRALGALMINRRIAQLNYSPAFGEKSFQPRDRDLLHASLQLKDKAMSGVDFPGHR
jgi:hypothetical protein